MVAGLHEEDKEVENMSDGQTDVWDEESAERMLCPSCGSEDVEFKEQMPSAFPDFNELWVCKSCGRHFVLWRQMCEIPEKTRTLPAVKYPAFGRLGATVGDMGMSCLFCESRKLKKILAGQRRP